MSFLSQTAAFFAVSESKMGTEAAPHQADDRTLAGEGREAGGDELETLPAERSTEGQEFSW